MIESMDNQKHPIPTLHLTAIGGYYSRNIYENVRNILTKKCLVENNHA
jgi:hypothetical protein